MTRDASTCAYPNDHAGEHDHDACEDAVAERQAEARTYMTPGSTSILRAVLDGAGAAREAGQQRCGCGLDYHSADCPIRTA